jgi:2-haloacid dehalogenase
VVFDLGGVLLDWNPRYLYQHLFNRNSDGMERFLTEIGFTEWNLEQDRGRPFDLAVAELSARFPHYADLIEAYIDRWEETIAGPIEGSVEILRELKQTGSALYGLSNWSRETFHRIRPRYQFLDWFEAIVISGEVQLVKPDPRIYQVLLRRIGRQAPECCFIDDSEPNVAAAARLGFKAIRFESPEQLRGELRRLGILGPGTFS